MLKKGTCKNTLSTGCQRTSIFFQYLTEGNGDKNNTNALGLDIINYLQ